MALKEADKVRIKYSQNKTIFADGSSNNWNSTIENGHWGHYEGPFMSDPTDEEVAKGAMELECEANEIGFKVPLSNSWMAVGEQSVKMYSPHCGNFHTWMQKIKKTFDPNNASDPVGYISAEEA